MIQVMDELYFLTSWTELKSKLTLSPSQLSEVLAHLINEELVEQLNYSETHKEFLRVVPSNRSTFKASSFLNSRKGLLWLHV